jgi:hypothetical protein
MTVLRAEIAGTDRDSPRPGAHISAFAALAAAFGGP